MAISSNRSLPIDTLRITAVFLVIASHTTYALHDKGVSGGILPYLYATIGQFGVSIFILVSGYLAGRSLERDTTIRFYWKRISGILPPIWVSFIFIGFFFFILKSAFGLSAYTAFERLIANPTPDSPIKPVSLMFSLLGLDGYIHVSRYDIEVYNIVAEWFIGFIIIILAISPALNYTLKRWGLIALSVCFVVSLLSFYYPQWEGPFSFLFVSWGNTLNPTTRLFEFAFGMYISQKLYQDDVPLGYVIFASIYVLTLIAIYIFNGHNLMVTRPEGFLFSCAVFFIVLYAMNKPVPKSVADLVTKLATVSFMCMLVHHQMVYLAVNNIPVDTLNNFGVIILFIIIAFLSFQLAAVLNPIAKTISKFLHSINFAKASTLTN